MTGNASHRAIKTMLWQQEHSTQERLLESTEHEHGDKGLRCPWACMSCVSLAQRHKSICPTPFTPQATLDKISRLCTQTQKTENGSNLAYNVER
jgi:hypothetical protein